MNRVNQELEKRVGRATVGMYPTTKQTRGRRARELAPLLEQATHSLELARGCGELGDPGVYHHLVYVKDACERALEQLARRAS